MSCFGTDKEIMTVGKLKEILKDVDDSKSVAIGWKGQSTYLHHVITWEKVGEEVPPEVLLTHKFVGQL